MFCHCAVAVRYTDRLVKQLIDRLISVACALRVVTHHVTLENDPMGKEAKNFFVDRWEVGRWISILSYLWPHRNTSPGFNERRGSESNSTPITATIPLSPPTQSTPLQTTNSIDWPSSRKEKEGKKSSILSPPFLPLPLLCFLLPPSVSSIPPSRYQTEHKLSSINKEQNKTIKKNRYRYYVNAARFKPATAILHSPTTDTFTQLFGTNASTYPRSVIPVSTRTDRYEKRWQHTSGIFRIPRRPIPGRSYQGMVPASCGAVLSTIAWPTV